MKLEDYYDKKTGKFDCGKISNLPDQSFDDYMDILIQAGLDEEYNRQDIEWETERQKYQQTLTMLREYPSGERRVVKWWISSYRAVSV